jgi:DNA (cytosine-5)-methyltransferase 1
LVFEEVQTDLEAQGYEVQPFLLPAASVNAPHRRDRIWFVAYSNNNRTGDGFGQIQVKDGEISEWNNNAESCNTDKFNDDATNTKSKWSWKLTSEDKGWKNRRLDNDGKIEYATDTNCEMLEHRNGCGENGWDNKEIRTESFNGPRKWETFPTVAPICNGDDGISDRLDSITFSKWRNESIKAGGNAIVPQVAHQIFKAIQEYERCNGRGL